MPRLMTTRIVTCGTCGASRRVVDGGALRHMRGDMGLRELAREIGYSAGMLSRVESNQRAPSPKVVAAYRRMYAFLTESHVPDRPLARRKRKGSNGHRG